MAWRVYACRHVAETYTVNSDQVGFEVLVGGAIGAGDEDGTARDGENRPRGKVSPCNETVAYSCQFVLCSPGRGDVTRLSVHLERLPLG